LAAVSLATRRRRAEIGASAAVSGRSGVISCSLNDGGSPWWIALFLTFGFTAAQLGWGMYIGSRRELLWTLRQRAERAEAEQGLRVAQAQSTERERIAREMHDVLAHRISQVSMHAGALAYRQDLAADELRDGAADIQRQANEALTDLRGVLGVLRDGSGDVLDRPQPTYADLPQLVAEARAGGLRVDYDDALSSAEVPVGLGRTVYRIVQEGITNARKHAPGAVLSIAVSGGPDEGLRLLLRNPLGFGPTDPRGRTPATGNPGAGLGLIGLTERAEIRAGWLRHGRDETSFTLEAWLPWSP
jgi:signal transduction histidine kinase